MHVSLEISLFKISLKVSKKFNAPKYVKSRFDLSIYLFALEFHVALKEIVVVLQVASVTFDLLLLLVLGSYLIVLFSFLVITTRVSIYLYLKSYAKF